MSEKTELVIFKTKDENIKLNVNVDKIKDTVWLSLDQISDLFERDKSTISRHIKNIFLEEELIQNSVVANFATTAADGKKYDVSYYNLDVIISVGYRVKSKRGIEFRKWANKVLKDYILKGYAVNNNRINQLGEIIQIMKRANNELDSKQILNVIEKYTVALDLLDDYDHQRLIKPQGSESIYRINYDECKKLISDMKFASESDLFGKELNDSFKSSINTIYQTFNGEDVYPSLEEKAANLLYLITKNHSFSDGNKRIAATVFLYFLDKNNMIFVDKKKIIDDFTLVAITIMIAESKSSEKDTIIKLIMNFFNKY